jgi:hypothetical protein
MPGIGYQCDHGETCPNSECRHKSAHLAQLKSALRGKFQTCVNLKGFCPYVQEFVNCIHVTSKVEAKV